MGHTRFSQLLIVLLVSTALSCSFVVPAFAKDTIDFETTGVVTFSRPNATTLQAGDSVTLEYRRVNRGTTAVAPVLYEHFFFNSKLVLNNVSSTYFMNLSKSAEWSPGDLDSQDISSVLKQMKGVAYNGDSDPFTSPVQPGNFASMKLTFNVTATINISDRLFYAYPIYSFVNKIDNGTAVQVAEDEIADTQGNIDNAKLETYLTPLRNGNDVDSPDRSNNLWTYFVPATVGTTTANTTVTTVLKSVSNDSTNKTGTLASNQNQSASAKKSNRSPSKQGANLESSSNGNTLGSTVAGSETSDVLPIASPLASKLPKRVAVRGSTGMQFSELFSRYGVIILLIFLLLTIVILYVLRRLKKSNGIFSVYRRALKIDAHNTKL